jgi:hypothetical protein
MPDKFDIKIDKKEVKKSLDDITGSDYYQRIAEQVKKIKTGQINETFKGNADKWKNLFHQNALDDYDQIVLSILRDEYQEYQQFIDPIKDIIDFHKLDLTKSLKKKANNEK